MWKISFVFTFFFCYNLIGYGAASNKTTHTCNFIKNENDVTCDINAAAGDTVEFHCPYEENVKEFEQYADYDSEKRCFQYVVQNGEVKQLENVLEGVFDTSIDVNSTQKTYISRIRIPLIIPADVTIQCHCYSSKIKPNASGIVNLQINAEEKIGEDEEVSEDSLAPEVEEPEEEEQEDDQESVDDDDDDIVQQLESSQPEKKAGEAGNNVENKDKATESAEAEEGKPEEENSVKVTESGKSSGKNDVAPNVETGTDQPQAAKSDEGSQSPPSSGDAESSQPPLSNGPKPEAPSVDNHKNIQDKQIVATDVPLQKDDPPAVGNGSHNAVSNSPGNSEKQKPAQPGTNGKGDNGAPAPAAPHAAPAAGGAAPAAGGAAPAAGDVGGGGSAGDVGGPAAGKGDANGAGPAAGGAGKGEDEDGDIVEPQDGAYNPEEGIPPEYQYGDEYMKDMLENPNGPAGSEVPGIPQGNVTHVIRTLNLHISKTLNNETRDQIKGCNFSGNSNMLLDATLSSPLKDAPNVCNIFDVKSGDQIMLLCPKDTEVRPPKESNRIFVYKDSDNAENDELTGDDLKEITYEEAVGSPILFVVDGKGSVRYITVPDGMNAKNALLVMTCQSSSKLYRMNIFLVQEMNAPNKTISDRIREKQDEINKEKSGSIRKKIDSILDKIGKNSSYNNAFSVVSLFFILSISYFF